MLRADVLGSKALGFFGSSIQDALALHTERHFNGSGDAFATRNVRFDFIPQGLRAAFFAKKLACEGQVLAEETEQQVLGFDGHISILAGFIAGEENRATRLLCVAFEHGLAHISSEAPAQLDSESSRRQELRKRGYTRESVKVSSYLAWPALPLEIGDLQLCL
jgi:hypothetical protein